MISNRGYLAMSSMMVILFFLFMMTSIVSQDKDAYSVNNYCQETYENVNNDASARGEDALENNSWSSRLIFVGAEDSEEALICKNWCAYTGGSLTFLSDADKLFSMDLEAVDLILISPDQADASKVYKLMHLAEEGCTLLFYSLPSVDDLKQYGNYLELFGIREIAESEVTLSGVKLFSGFLLGGETIYLEEEPEEEMQDLDITIPWFKVDNCVKTYMVGLFDEDVTGGSAENENYNEELPPIIWRCGHGDGFVYAVNGDYFGGAVGMGILSGIMAEEKDCYLYPVINAQNITITDFPCLSDENGEELNEIYSRSATRLSSDILLPSLVAFLQTCDKKATVYMMLQADYGDSNMPEADDVELYMEQFYQNEVEIGRSMVLYDDISITEKLQLDSIFYELYMPSYTMTAAYIEDADTLNFDGAEAYNEQLRTFVTGRDSDNLSSVVDCLDNITRQNIVSDAYDYTYHSDLEMRSVQTVLGYSNVLMDFGRVYLPGGEEDHWEILSEEYFSVANTYFKPFKVFDQTTASESDKRIRSFLNTDYSYEVNGDIVTLTVSNGENAEIDCYFVLRTHNEIIEEAKGAEYTEIEEDAYLIHVLASEVTLKVENKDLKGTLTF